MRFTRRRRRFDDPRELRGTLHQRQVLRFKLGQVDRAADDTRLRSAPMERSNAGMRILNIEDRIVLRRLDHLGEIEVHLGIGLARQHGEADHVLADFFAPLRQA